MDWIEQLTQMASGVADSILGPSKLDLGGPRRSPVPTQTDDQDTLTQLAQTPQRRMAYSHSMADLVANKYVADPGSYPADSVPFYPSDKHINSNLAPERTIGRNEMERLAQARFKAIDLGVLDKDLADYMLPIAMVEGRPNSYGISHDNGFYASPYAKRVFSQMGIPLDTTGKNPDAPLVMTVNKRGEKMINLTEQASEWKPELMAAILAIKAKGTHTPEEAIERWNGGGSQARHYRGKVQRARELLDHPQNKEIRNLWSEVTGED